MIAEELSDIDKDVLFVIVRCLWIDYQPVNVAYDKCKLYFTSIPQFLEALCRIAPHREELVAELSQI